MKEGPGTVRARGSAGLDIKISGIDKRDATKRQRRH